MVQKKICEISVDRQVVSALPARECVANAISHRIAARREGRVPAEAELVFTRSERGLQGEEKVNSEFRSTIAHNNAIAQREERERLSGE
jgi:hypothetical protein